MSTCSVAASYKPPMLVTRVRLPACAVFVGFARDPPSIDARGAGVRCVTQCGDVLASFRARTIMR